MEQTEKSACEQRLFTNNNTNENNKCDNVNFFYTNTNIFQSLDTNSEKKTPTFHQKNNANVFSSNANSSSNSCNIHNSYIDIANSNANDKKRNFNSDLFSVTDQLVIAPIETIKISQNSASTSKNEIITFTNNDQIIKINNIMKHIKTPHDAILYYKNHLLIKFNTSTYERSIIHFYIGQEFLRMCKNINNKNNNNTNAIEATKHFTKSIQLNKNYGDPLISLAILEYKNNDVKRALIYIKLALVKPLLYYKISKKQECYNTNNRNNNNKHINILRHHNNNSQCARYKYCNNNHNDNRRCGRCKTIAYCSRQCQINDWKKHSQMCIPRKILPPASPDQNKTNRLRLRTK